MDDLIKSIKAQLYDRTTSPLSGAFVLSWVIWNYKTLFVLFSSMGVDEKFDYISIFLYPTSLDCLLTGFIYPLTTTAFFIFIYPYPAKFVYEFWRNRQTELKKIRQQIEDETPLTLEESRRLRRHALQLENEYEKEIERRDNEIRRLRENSDEPLPEIRKFGDGSAIDKEITDNASEEKGEIVINDKHLNMLQLVAKLGGEGVRKIWLRDSSELDTVEANYLIGELLIDGYLKQQYSRAKKDTLYTLTHKGNETLVKHKNS